jgi:putative resolvase
VRDRRNGVSERAAYRWFHAGTLPVPARQTTSGTILVDVAAPAREGGEGDKVVLYARVSSHNQKAGLERQLGRLVAWASERDLVVARAVTEVGSGSSGARPKLRKLLSDPSVSTLVVERRDRLARFGVEYLEAALSAAGRTLLVIEQGELEDDLVRDTTEVLTSFRARLYGRRSAKRRAQAATAAQVAAG